jgi:hypothetical protein
MSWGTQFFYRSSPQFTFNYSTFLGTDKPDSLRLWRIYHNLYAILQFNKKIGLIAGFDIGSEQKSKGSSDQNIWYSPVAIIRFVPNAYWTIAVRGEYFSDPGGVLIVTGTDHGFRTRGVSINIDRSFGERFLWRVEFRVFRSKDAIFLKANDLQKSNSAITSSFAFAF